MENKKLTWEVITEKFPEFFENCYCGHGCGDGWLPIIYGLCASIKRQEVKGFEFHQIKEKFGTLRIYWGFKYQQEETARNGLKMFFNVVVKHKCRVLLNRIGIKLPPQKRDPVDVMVGALVDMAEYISDHTCEVCGKPGSCRGGGWLKTLCDECNAK